MAGDDGGEPPDGLADELTEAMDQCFGLMAAAERQFLDILDRFAAIGGHRLDGARTIADWLCERYSLSRERANGFATVAHGLVDLPHLAQAYGAGSLSIDQLKPLVRVADERTDEYLAAEAPGWSEAQCRVVASRIRKITRDEDAETHGLDG